MMGFAERHCRKFRSAQFVPSSLGTSGQIHLEARALTAPLFWRKPYAPIGDPTRDDDYAVAMAAGPFTPPTAPYYQFAEFHAQAGSSSTNTIPTATLTFSGTAQTDIVDVTQTLPPASPVGVPFVSMDVATTIAGSYSGNGDLVYNYFTSEAGAGRLYTIADSGIPSGPTTVEEHATVEFVPGMGSIDFSVWVGLGDGLSITAIGDSGGINYADIYSNVVPVPSSGTFTAYNGATVTYAVTSTDIEVSSSTSVGVLSTITRDMVDHGVGGTRWGAFVVARLAVVEGHYAGNATGSASLATHYEAQFA